MVFHMNTFIPKDKSPKTKQDPIGSCFYKSSLFNYFLGFLVGADPGAAGLYANSLSGTSQ